MSEIVITIPRLAPLLNRYRAMHWTMRRRETGIWAQEMNVALIGQRPAQPIAKSAVTIYRHSTHEPDMDGLVASAKIILDVLQPPSKRHPYGLGIIADDKASACDLTVRWIKAAHRPEQRTVIVVRDYPHDAQVAA